MIETRNLAHYWSSLMTTTSTAYTDMIYFMQILNGGPSFGAVTFANFIYRNRNAYMP